MKTVCAYRAKPPYVFGLYYLLFYSVLILNLTFLSTTSRADEVISYDLDQAITTALENNRLRTISQQSLEIAEAQYQQAQSAYWPTLSLNASFQRRDESAIFEYPEMNFDLAPGMLPPVNIPPQEIDILGRDTSLYSLEMTYPLYTGGKRSSLVKQARIGIDIASKEVHRTDLQVVQDVKRYFYAALYTRQLRDLAEEITISFEVLRDVTQAFYEGGSNSVNKLDLLQSRLVHALADATLAEITAKHESSLAALAFAMGLDWREEINLKNPAYPTTVDNTELEILVEQALQFNPQVGQLSLAVDAYEAKIDEAQSDHYPMIGLTASLDGFNNNLDGGLSTETNEDSWKLGIGMQLKLFNGGLTRHRVSAAKVGYAQKKQQMLLISESVATQVKHLFLQTNSAQRQIEITQQAVETAQENRDLSNRAYQTGAVKTEKVIEANLMDAMVRANHFRAMHDQALHLAEIAYLLGKEVVE
ncbi:MAG: TolC family protein [Candidatus Thiodiazotropha sp. (ex Semelilucina semeliformis)]|nr:TolC family protein [Candidatus Thiodiazotropha sp. (ex Semelilucina semeliformis)]